MFYYSCRLQERIKHLEELVANSEQSFAKLEQEFVQVTKVSPVLNWLVKPHVVENSAWGQG